MVNHIEHGTLQNMSKMGYYPIQPEIMDYILYRYKPMTQISDIKRRIENQVEKLDEAKKALEKAKKEKIKESDYDNDRDFQRKSIEHDRLITKLEENVELYKLNVKGNKRDLKTALYNTQNVGLVIDPFMGSGEALMQISKTLNLNPYGIELNEDRYNAALKLIKEQSEFPFLKSHFLQGAFEHTHLSNNSFGLWYVNPPYRNGRYEADWIKLVSRFSSKHIHFGKYAHIIFVLPETALKYYKVQDALFDNFSNIEFARFPMAGEHPEYPDNDYYNRESGGFTQWVVFASSNRVSRRYNIESENDLKMYLKSPETAPHICKTANISQQEINPTNMPSTFRMHNRAQQALEGLSSGNSVFDDESFRNDTEHDDDMNIEVLMPLSDGHAATIAASGYGNNSRPSEDAEERLIINGFTVRGVQADKPTVNPDGTINVTYRDQNTMILSVLDLDYEGDDPEEEAFKNYRSDHDPKEYSEAFERYAPTIIENTRNRFKPKWSPEKTEELALWIDSNVYGPGFLPGFTKIHDPANHERVLTVLRYNKSTNQVMLIDEHWVSDDGSLKINAPKEEQFWVSVDLIKDTYIESKLLEEQRRVVEALAYKYQQDKDPASFFFGQMGVGKTTVAAALQATIHRDKISKAAKDAITGSGDSNFPLLIVCPPHLVNSKWKHEVEVVLRKFSPIVTVIGQEEYPVLRVFKDIVKFPYPIRNLKINPQSVIEKELILPVESKPEEFETVHEIWCAACKYIGDEEIVAIDDGNEYFFRDLEDVLDHCYKHDSDLACPVCGNPIAYWEDNYEIEVFRSEDTHAILGDWEMIDNKPYFFPFDCKEIILAAKNNDSHAMIANRGAIALDKYKKLGLSHFTKEDLLKYHSEEFVDKLPYYDSPHSMNDINEYGEIPNRYWTPANTGDEKQQYMWWNLQTTILQCPMPSLSVDVKWTDENQIPLSINVERYEIILDDEGNIARIMSWNEHGSFKDIDPSRCQVERDEYGDIAKILYTDIKDETSELQINLYTIVRDHNNVITQMNMDAVLDIEGMYFESGSNLLTLEGNPVIKSGCKVHRISFVRSNKGYWHNEQENESFNPKYTRTGGEMWQIRIQFVQMNTLLPNYTIYNGEKRTMPLKDLDLVFKNPGFRVGVIANTTLRNGSGWKPAGRVVERKVRYTENSKVQYEKIPVVLDPNTGQIIRSSENSKPVSPDTWFNRSKSAARNPSNSRITFAQELAFPYIKNIDENGDVTEVGWSYNGRRFDFEPPSYNKLGYDMISSQYCIVYDFYMDKNDMVKFDVLWEGFEDSIPDLYSEPLDDNQIEEINLKIERNKKILQGMTEDTDAYKRIEDQILNLVMKTKAPRFDYRGDRKVFLSDLKEFEYQAPAYQLVSTQDNPSPYIGKRRIPLSEYTENLGPFALIVDEVHEMAGKNSIQGITFANLASQSSYLIALTGTIMNGYSSSIFRLFWRIRPHILNDMGFGFNSVSTFVKRYGFSKQSYSFNDRESFELAKQTGIRATQKGYNNEAPGVVPNVLQMFMSWSAFTSIDEFRYSLPPLDVKIIEIEMDKEISDQYNRMYHGLPAALSIVSKRNPEVKDQRSAYMWACMRYPDFLGKEKFITKYVKEKDGVLVGPLEEIWAHEIPYENFEEGTPKFKHIVDQIVYWHHVGIDEYGDPHRSIIYVGQTKRANIAPEFLRLIDQREEGLVTAVLEPSQITVHRSGKEDVVLKVKPNERSEKMDELMQKYDINVLITNPKLVRTGMDLVDFSRMYWVGPTTFEIIVLMQAQARIHRLGQKKDVIVEYVVYKDTLEYLATRLMADKMGANNLLRGKMDANTLASFGMAGDSVEKELLKIVFEEFQELSEAEVDELVVNEDDIPDEEEEE